MQQQCGTRLDPILNLCCCCCGNATRGRQWWNRDCGFGLCDRCISFARVEGVPVGAEAPSYGIRGYHWDVGGEKQ